MSSKRQSTQSNDPTFGSKITNRLKRFVEATERGDDVLEKLTSRKVHLNIAPENYTPELVRQTRSLLGISQSLFAQFLGVSVSALQDWEQGQKSPQGSACRLMDEIRHDPNYWLSRLRELATPHSA